jgi:hypothetical protein
VTYQTARNIRVAYKAETTFNTLAGATGGYQFRVNRGGMNLTKSPINSNEIRPDGLVTRGRHGQRDVKGSYEGDLSLATFDPLFEGGFRNTWGAALSITQATGAMSSATLSVAAHAITASGGSWITAGLRIGDVIRLTAGFVSGNLNRNLRVTALTATVITVQETLTVEAGPLSTYTVARPKTLLMGTAPHSFTVEETHLDIDASEVFTGCRVGKTAFSLTPNNMSLVTFDFVGADQQIMTSGSSPYYTAPTDTTSIGMTAVEAAILLNGVTIADLTKFDIAIDLKAAGTNIVGATITPDVFTNRMEVTASIGGLMQDLQHIQDFISETQFSLQALFTENEAEPKDFFSVYVPNFTFASGSKDALGGDGPRSLTMDLLVGADDSGAAAGHDQTSVKLQTSAA